MNALKAMLPELDSQGSSIPCGTADLRNGYSLLAKCEHYPTKVTVHENQVITAYLSQSPPPKVHHWAQLHLPNGVACSQFAELESAPDNV